MDKWDTYIHSEEKNRETGFVRKAEWRLNDELHRPDDPALIQYSPKTDRIVAVSWFQHGKPHRENGPAMIGYDEETGRANSFSWYRHGVEHRDNGPSELLFRKMDGLWRVARAEWKQNGEYHREDGPAEVIRGDRHDHYILRAWFWNGTWHRVGGPAVIIDDPENQRFEKSYYNFGVEIRTVPLHPSQSGGVEPM